MSGGGGERSSTITGQQMSSRAARVGQQPAGHALWRRGNHQKQLGNWIHPLPGHRLCWVPVPVHHVASILAGSLCTPRQQHSYLDLHN